MGRVWMPLVRRMKGKNTEGLDWEKYNLFEYHFRVEATEVLYIATLVEESFHLKLEHFVNKL